MYKQPELSEKHIQMQILSYVVHFGFFWRQNRGGMPKEYTDKKGRKKQRFINFGTSGISDILGCLKKDGRFVAIEVKRRKGKGPTPEQLEFLRRVKEAGGIGIVAYCIEDVMAIIK